jgi:hypothetical protein
MGKRRSTIGGLMAVVLVLAIGLAALRNPSVLWVGTIFLATRVILALGAIGVVLRKHAERAWWLGFSVFGWGYLVLLTPSPTTMTSMQLPTWSLLAALRPALGPSGELMAQPNPGVRLSLGYFEIGHDLLALLAAFLGALLVRAIFASPAGPPGSPHPDPDADPTIRPSRKRWLRPIIIALVGLILVFSVFTIGFVSDAAFWAGATFSLTSGLMGLVTLGAIFGRGRKREAWLGATFFGAGYLLLVFARPPYPALPTLWRPWGPTSAPYIVYARYPHPPLPTVQFLDGIRNWISDGTTGSASAKARTLEALERPIAMRFPNATSLEDLVKYVKQATTTPTRPGIPIYVDPIGLLEAERTLKSTVSIDLEGVPLKTTLRLCLDQIGLIYEVDNGCVRIIAERNDDSPPVQDSFLVVDAPQGKLTADQLESFAPDPLLVIGHCLLAMIAAGLGGVLAPLVSDASGERPGRGGLENSPAPTRVALDQAGPSDQPK